MRTPHIARCLFRFVLGLFLMACLPAQSFDDLRAEAEAKARANDAAAALPLVDAAIALDGNRWEGHSLRAELLLTLGRGVDAVVSATLALEKAPAEQKAALDTLLVRAKAAAVLAKPATGPSPQVQKLLAEAEAAEKAGKKALAAEKLAAAFAADASQAPAGLDAAVIYAELDDTVEAVKLLRVLAKCEDKAIAAKAGPMLEKLRESAAPQVKQKLVEANIEFDAGNLAKVVGLLDAVDGLWPDDAEALYLRAKVLVRQQKSPAALEALQQARVHGFDRVATLRTDRDMAELTRDAGAATWLEEVFGKKLLAALRELDRATVAAAAAAVEAKAAEARAVAAAAAAAAAQETKAAEARAVAAAAAAAAAEEAKAAEARAVAAAAAKAAAAETKAAEARAAAAAKVAAAAAEAKAADARALAAATAAGICLPAFAEAPGSLRDAATNCPTRIVHVATGAVLVLIPAGQFLMGSPASEASHKDNETQHRRVIRSPFYLGESEVTQAQWQKVMGNNPSSVQGLNHPVDSVSWDDCQVFLQKAGDGLRLPSEAEWEYACRAGTTASFSFGESITREQVNFAGLREGEPRGRALPSLSLPPNPWGLHEMHGNVSEWCQDVYGDYPGTGTDKPLDGNGARVLRGGSWDYSANFSRSAYRSSYGAGRRSITIGMRVARTLSK